MTQPSLVPSDQPDQVRSAWRFHVPKDWRAQRPAEMQPRDKPEGRGFGSPGPDQGYALLVAHELFGGKLNLVEGEHDEDAIEGCAAIASARSSLFGRAPVAKDIEVALTLFGYLGEPPADLVSWRSACFKSAAHEYSIRRMLVSMVPERTLRLSPKEVSGSISDWKSMLEIPEGEA